MIATALVEGAGISVASKTGIVSQLNTEDSNAGGGFAGAVGMYGSICANRLGTLRHRFAFVPSPKGLIICR
jgi:hypothetical protein